MMFDTNHDGVVDVRDLPQGVHPGTKAAKLWWQKVEDHAEKVGKFNGESIIHGQVGPGAAKWNMLVTKLQVVNGLSHESALRVAGKIKAMKYGR